MNWKRLRDTLAIALIALTGSACSVSRQATEVSSSRVQVSGVERDSVRVEQVMVAVHDTIMETVTITVDRNESGDTVRVSTVTDRLRGRSRDAIATQRTKTVVRVDTIYIEKRDTVSVKDSRFTGHGDQNGNTALHGTLKWIFAIIVAVIALIIVVRIRNLGG